MSTAPGFKVGALVIATTENSSRAKAMGGAPIGNTVRPGDVGEIIEGPHPHWYLGEPMPYWHVAWRGGRKTWSGQRFLAVIGDKAPSIETVKEAAL